MAARSNLKLCSTSTPAAANAAEIYEVLDLLAAAVEEVEVEGSFILAFRQLPFGGRRNGSKNFEIDTP